MSPLWENTAWGSLHGRPCGVVCLNPSNGEVEGLGFVKTLTSVRLRVYLQLSHVQLFEGLAVVVVPQCGFQGPLVSTLCGIVSWRFANCLLFMYELHNLLAELLGLQAGTL
jgi:hypothetical protein